MKKIFLARRNALLSSANISWGASALAFAILALLARLLAPDLFLQTFTPAFRAADTIAATSHAFINGFKDAAALAARNERLEDENAALASENQALREKEGSISELLVGYSTNPVGVVAGVVARPPESPYDTLVLAAGSLAGVTLGMEAFGAGGVPLGAVSAVTAGFSRVTLFSAPGFVTRGWVGRASIPVDIFGAGGGAMNASFPHSADVAVGDTVFAPGPGKLPVGSVVRIDGDPSTSGITLRILPIANPFSLSWVLLRDVGAALHDSFFLATSTS